MKDSNDSFDPVQEVQQGVPQRWGPGASVGVIGGLGEMGRLFSNFFRQSGYRVIVADRATPVNSRQAVETSDIVVFAVPLHQTVAVIRELLPFVRSDQLLLDLSSLKTAPIEAMLCSPASVVGLHPMFGGKIASFAGQTLAACPVRIAETDWVCLRDLFVRQNIKVKECTPAEHDHMMSIIQVLLHMTTMLMGRVLRDMGVDITETMEYTSPSYRLEMNLVGRMFAQNGALYSAISQMNPNTGDILRLLKAGLEDYQKWYATEDLDGFIADFEQSARHLGDFCRDAFRESSAILNFTVRRAHQNGRESPD